MNSNKSFPTLSSERLVLDQLAPTDAADIFDIFSDPEVVRHYDVELFKEPEEGANLIEYFQARFDSDTGIRWAIRSRSTGAFLGSCGFNAWNEYDYSAVIGYELKPNYWGQGFAKEAIMTIVSYLLSESFRFHVNRIEALILPTNIPSRNVAEKCGFVFEGTLRGKCYWNGDFHNMNMFSLLRKDFEIIRQTK